MQIPPDLEDRSPWNTRSKTEHRVEQILFLRTIHFSACDLFDVFVVYLLRAALARVSSKKPRFNGWT